MIYTESPVTQANWSEAPMNTVVFALFGIAAFSGISAAQAPSKVDFAKDVQPMLRQNCVGCHGPAQQINGLRLDRKSSVFRAGLRRVVPGSSVNSFVYHRLVWGGYWEQNPPPGPPEAAQDAVLQTRVDQRADVPALLVQEAGVVPVE